MLINTKGELIFPSIRANNVHLLFTIYPIFRRSWYLNLQCTITSTPGIRFQIFLREWAIFQVSISSACLQNFSRAWRRRSYRHTYVCHTYDASSRNEMLTPSAKNTVHPCPRKFPPVAKLQGSFQRGSAQWLFHREWYRVIGITCPRSCSSNNTPQPRMFEVALRA